MNTQGDNYLNKENGIKAAIFATGVIAIPAAKATYRGAKAVWNWATSKNEKTNKSDKKAKTTKVTKQ